MRKKVIKAHQGMAHVPRTGGQRTPTRPPTKGRGRPPTGGRMIGLPQRFRGGGRRPSTQKQNLPAWAKKASGGRETLKNTPVLNTTEQIAAAAASSPLSRAQLKALRDQYIQGKNRYPRTSAGVLNWAKDSLNKNKDKVQPVYEKPNRGKRFLINPSVAPPPSESVKAPAPQTLRPILPQVRYKGGYVSRAKYGQVNNLKKKK